MQTLMQNAKESLLGLKRKCESLVQKVRQALLTLKQRLKPPSQ
jgi:hypothetical protein